MARASSSRSISRIDEQFMFDVKQSVENKTDKEVTLFPWALIVRHGEPKAEGTYVLHEGPYGVFNGSLKEFGYNDFKDNKRRSSTTTGGWIGITDKYWMAALDSRPEEQGRRHAEGHGRRARDKYQVDYVGAGIPIAAGATASTENHLFAGAKIVRIMDGYRDKLGIDRFDLTIDWGWFWFFTKPLFWLLEWLYQEIGNFGVSILILTVIVKAIFFPLANKSYAAMSKMKALQPEMEKMKAALRRGPPAAEPGDDAALSPREGEPGGGLPADPAADPGVLRALQGALHHDRDAPSAVLRLDPRPERARSADDLHRLRPVPLAGAGVPALLQHRPVAARHGRDDVPAAEAEPRADRSGPGARVPVPADHVHLHDGAVLGRPGDLLGVEQHAVDRPAVLHHAPPRHAGRQQGKPAAAPAVTDVTDLSEKGPPEKKKGGKGSAKKG